MNNMYKILIWVTVIIVGMKFFASSAAVKPKKCVNRCVGFGSVCGGFTTPQNQRTCCPGLTCKGNLAADETGKCVNKCVGFGSVCGGFTTPENQRTCCPGLTCEGNLAADETGKCRNKCVGLGSVCGGFTTPENQRTCCRGLTCEGDLASDKPGKCVKCALVGQTCDAFTKPPVSCCPGMGLICGNKNPNVTDLGGKCEKMSQ